MFRNLHFLWAIKAWKQISKIQIVLNLSCLRTDGQTKQSNKLTTSCQLKTRNPLSCPHLVWNPIQNYNKVMCKNYGRPYVTQSDRPDFLKDGLCLSVSLNQILKPEYNMGSNVQAAARVYKRIRVTSFSGTCKLILIFGAWGEAALFFFTLYHILRYFFTQ